MKHDWTLRLSDPENHCNLMLHHILDYAARFRDWASRCFNSYSQTRRLELGRCLTLFTHTSVLGQENENVEKISSSVVISTDASDAPLSLWRQISKAKGPPLDAPMAQKD